MPSGTAKSASCVCEARARRLSVELPPWNRPPIPPLCLSQPALIIRIVHTSMMILACHRWIRRQCYSFAEMLPAVAYSNKFDPRRFHYHQPKGTRLRHSF
jgi:hypothetical protein